MREPASTNLVNLYDFTGWDAESTLGAKTSFVSAYSACPSGINPCNAPFANLSQLQIGDKVYIAMGDMNYTFTVSILCGELETSLQVDNRRNDEPPAILLMGIAHIAGAYPQFETVLAELQPGSRESCS
jgi:hypothetical protein